MSDMETLLKRVARIDNQIEVLQEQIVLKQRERQEILDSARATLDTLRPAKHVNGMAQRGPAKGTPNTRQRSLTDKQVREIRTKYASGKYSQRELGEMYGGLAQPVINSIVHRRTYQEVE
jgi:hypothetical protein